MLRLLLTLPLLLALQTQDTAPRTEGRGTGRMLLVARASVGEELAAQLAAVGGEGATRFVLALSEEETLAGVDRCISRESLADANDRELARRVREADVLVVRGGSLMGWYKTTLHERGRTLLFHALLDRVRLRQTVIAYGGAAAFFCAGTTIPRTELDEPPRNPRYAHTQVPRAAMRLGPPALLGSADWSEGSALRWFHSLWQTRMELGLYLVGDVALDYSREGRELRVLGPGHVIACDLGRARRQKWRLEGARLSMLRAGDGWSFGFERALPAPDRVRVSVDEGEPGDLPGSEFEWPPGVHFEVALDAGSSAWRRGESGERIWLAAPMRLAWDAPLFLPADEARAPR